MTAYSLNPVSLARLDEARARAHVSWRLCAKVAIDEMQANPQAPAMVVYQEIAYTLGAGLSTVRQWTRHEKLFGEMLDELTTPDGDCLATTSHLRLAEREARRTGDEPTEVLLRRINEADKYGGRLIPPDAWAAELRDNAPEDANPLDAALDRVKRNLLAACKSAATALGNVKPKDLRRRELLEALAGQVDMALETVEKLA
jgi:hypothetical protein